jgi:quercetin dioxygenase-like cupin family protein
MEQQLHTNHSLVGWDIVHGVTAEWMPWGGDGAPARAKVLGSGDGYVLVLVEASAGYVGAPHVHDYAEMSYVVHGTVEHQGVPMAAGDGYVASAGSTHTGFSATSDATYVLAFKL